MYFQAQTFCHWQAGEDRAVLVEELSSEEDEVIDDEVDACLAAR